LLLLGTSEGVDPECATSCRYIGQGVTEEYNANPIGAVESNVINANAERIVTFFIFPLPQFVFEPDYRIAYTYYLWFSGKRESVKRNLARACVIIPGMKDLNPFWVWEREAPSRQNGNRF
jgi:hypothetical protein